MFPKLAAFIKRYKPVFRLLVILYFVFLLRKFLYLGCWKIFAEGLRMDRVGSSTELDIAATSLVGLSIGYLAYMAVVRALWPSRRSWLMGGILLVWYVLFARIYNPYQLVPMGYFDGLKYLDVLFIVFLVLAARLEYYTGPIPAADGGFWVDSYDANTDSDLLGREKLAAKLIRGILNTGTMGKAFVLAVNSQWGFGKSALMGMMIRLFRSVEKGKFQTIYSNMAGSSPAAQEIRDLEERAARTVVIEYNPWKNFDEKIVVVNFFDELAEGLGRYDKKLAKYIKEYGAILTKLDQPALKKVAEVSTDFFDKKEALSKVFDRINELIDRSGKRIVIFIDDLDRLNGDELVDILKLIRNTANFKNTFFVVAYDHNYVLNAIDKRGLIANKEEYLHKIVQLEITLPSFRKVVIMEMLYRKIAEYGYDILFVAQLRSTMDRVGNEMLPVEALKPTTVSGLESLRFTRDNGASLLYQVLQHVRDVVRFVNSFRLTMSSLGDIGDLFEIVLLELLRVRYISVYQLLMQKELLMLDEGKLVLDTKQFQEFRGVCSRFNVKEADLVVVERILMILFDRNRAKYFRSIVYPRYYDLYFSGNAPGLDALAILDEALDGDVKEMFRLVDEAVEKDGGWDIANFILSQDTFADQAEFEAGIKAMLYLGKYIDLRNLVLLTVKNLIGKEITAQEIYEAVEGVGEFLLSCLADVNFDARVRAALAGEELNKLIKRRNQQDAVQIFIEDEDALRDIVVSCLLRVIAERGRVDDEVIRIYLQNLENVEPVSLKMKMLPAANALMRELVLRGPFEYLVDYFIQIDPEPSHYGQYYRIDAFVVQYFGDWEAVKSFLHEPETSDLFQGGELEQRYYKFMLWGIEEFARNRYERFLVRERKDIDLVLAIKEHYKKQQSSEMEVVGGEAAT